MKTVCVLGEGAWGTAIATLLASNNIEVQLWCYDKNIAEDIKISRYNNRYLPNVYLDAKIKPITDIAKATKNVSWIFEAIPVKFLRKVIEEIKQYAVNEKNWVILSKGIEQDTLLLPSQIIDDVFKISVPKAVLLGPSYAQDLAHKEITAVTLGVNDCMLGYSLQELLNNDYFRSYLSLDIMGAQVGAAIKNVITLAVGMLDGAGHTDNVKAFILTRGLTEMITLAKLYNGRPETLYGLCGVGDLVLTAMGKLSKNREVGRRLGKGQKLEKILDETGYIPEGINTVNSVHQLIENHNLDLPICNGVYQIINGKQSIDGLLTLLMQRPPEQDCVF
ncbi:MAG: NAD(P)H-dependent glycerol-3-phosphate dehydrogenase [Candidatus Babeliales bacterium]